MKTLSSTTVQASAPQTTAGSNLETFSTTLSDGRVITIREMIGRDLIYMEKDLSKSGDVEKGMKIIERLIVGDEKITYEEILDLGVKDFKKLSDLVASANGDDDEGDSPK
jgi:hypothetical protein